MAQLNLGKVKFVWRGDYNPATVYQKDDVVAYLGSAWVCKTADTINVEPEEPSANWDVMTRGIVATAFTQALLTAPTAAAARTVLELGNAALATIGTGAGNVLGASNATAYTIGFLQAIDAAEARFALGLSDAATTSVATIRSDRQPVDATLTALAAVVTAANKLIYATGVDTFATTDLSAFARTLLDDADAAAARATLGITVSPFTTEFVSTPQVVTFGASIIVPHGFTVGGVPTRPKNWKLKTQYAIAQNGFAVGDITSMPDVADGYSSSTGTQVEVTDTNIIVHVATSGWWVVRKDTRAAALVTAANVRLIVEAWL